MSQAKRYLHFTIGPMQAFVAQARRTRDFWAGSFLLSWLSAVAMKSVQQLGGRIISPVGTEDLLPLLEFNDNQDKRAGITHASMPNQFKAEVNQQFQVEQVSANVKQAWRALADLIFQNDIDKNFDAEQLRLTKDIWDRQINGCWEISWVLVEAESDNHYLSQRKHWRSYTPPVEAGVKCMMMSGWQELSGADKPSSQRLEKFWKILQAKMPMDLRDQEALCAIALVKRRFVRYFDQLNQGKIEMAGDWVLAAWQVPTAIPSVAYIAAAHWLRRLVTENAEAELAQFYKIVQELFADVSKNDNTNVHNEWQSSIKCIEAALNESQSIKKAWLSLSGDLYHRALLENNPEFNRQQSASSGSNQEKLNQAVRALAQLNQKVGLTPAPYYAMLIMDGDRLGELLKTTKPKKISQSLYEFTKKVPNIVKDNNGFLIYAGGDDVLAILPIEDALHCAVKLRATYKSCFAQTSNATISAAIVFAHIKTALTRIIELAHYLLDEVVKQQCGRDSLALRVQKPSDKVLQWAQPWPYLLENLPDTEASNAFTQASDKSDSKVSDKTQSMADENTRFAVMQQLIQVFSSNDRQVRDFSNSFVYRLREYFSLTTAVDSQQQLIGASLSSNEQQQQDFNQYKQAIVNLVGLDFLRSSKSLMQKQKQTSQAMAEAQKMVRPLIDLCDSQQRIKQDEHSYRCCSQQTLSIDAVLLIKFLAQYGVFNAQK